MVGLVLVDCPFFFISHSENGRVLSRVSFDFVIWFHVRFLCKREHRLSQTLSCRGYKVCRPLLEESEEKRTPIGVGISFNTRWPAHQ